MISHINCHYSNPAVWNYIYRRSGQTVLIGAWSALRQLEIEDFYQYYISVEQLDQFDYYQYYILADQLEQFDYYKELCRNGSSG